MKVEKKKKEEKLKKVNDPAKSYTKIYNKILRARSKRELEDRIWNAKKFKKKVSEADYYSLRQLKKNRMAELSQKHGNSSTNQFQKLIDRIDKVDWTNLIPNIAPPPHDFQFDNVPLLPLPLSPNSSRHGGRIGIALRNRHRSVL